MKPGNGIHRGLPAAVLALVASAFLALPAVALARTAYVANAGSDNVIPIDTATDAAGAAIAVGDNPSAIAITPDGATAYVANQASDNITPIDTATNMPGAPIAVGDNPSGIAITPDGATVYVVNAGPDNVIPIDTATNTAGAAIAVGDFPRRIAITPDGATAYVTNNGSDDVTPIDTATDTAGAAIAVGGAPLGMAITPDGSTAYVANQASQDVTPIDTATDTAGVPIVVGSQPQAIAIPPDGATAYVVDADFDRVTPIDTATDTAGAVIEVGDFPLGIAITPDGATAYVSNNNDDSVTPIDTATDTAGAPITVGDNPVGIAITPDQPPEGAFSTRPAIAGSATDFDATGSTDPDGTVATYDWDFGDGNTDAEGGVTPSHAYAAPGTYEATLTVTDDEGCSTELIFTGQTALCNGSDVAQVTHTIAVEPPPPDFEITAVKLNRDHGTATLTVEAEVAGGLRLAKTKKVRPTEAVAIAAKTPATLEVVARKRATKRLRRTGRAKVNPRVLFAPDAGGEFGKRRQLTLRRR